MKKFFAAAGVLTAVFVSQAVAADLIVDEPALANLPDVDAADWSGFYAGVFGSYSSGTADTYTFGVLGSDVRVSGPMIGATVGANAQFDNLVLGAEGDIAWSGVSGSEPCDDDPFFTCGRSIDWLSTFRGRAGLALDQALIYATAGLAIGGVSATTDPIPVDSDGAYSGTFVGWTVGAGAEMKLTDAVSVRAEYAYTDLGEHALPEGSIYSFPPDAGASLHPTLHTVKLGLNFAF